MSCRSKAHDLGEEVTNLHQQADATARVVKSLDVQLETITTEVDGTTSSLLRAEDELAVKKAVLQRRLIDIYKRGPMYTTEALLAARTFGELLGRYKYLHELAVRDRALVARVEDLYDQVAKQRQQLVRLREQFERSRQESVRRRIASARSRNPLEEPERRQAIREGDRGSPHGHQSRRDPPDEHHRGIRGGA